MDDIYKAWDSSQPMEFMVFGADYLRSRTTLTDEQAKLLVALVDEFVEAATRRQMKYIEGVSDIANAQIARDVESIPESVYSSVDEALSRSAVEYAGMSRKEVELAVKGKNRFWRRLRNMILGDAEDGGLAGEMKPLLDKAMSGEVAAFFHPVQDSQMDVGSVESSTVPQSDAYVHEQKVMGTLRRANISQIQLDELKELESSEMRPTASECVIKGLGSGLMSVEEGVLKRLAALQLIVAYLAEHGDEVDFAPLAALGAAKTAYELVGTQKASLHLARMDQLMEAVDGLGVGAGQSEGVRDD